MERKKVAKLAGFTGALCATAALAGFTVSSTGAYFSDTKDGSVSASSGHLTLNSSENRNLRFDNLTPGVNKTQDINFNVDTTAPAADVWMVFDKSSTGYQLLTGGKGSSNVPDGGLGRFGYFAVKASDHVGGATGGFQSGNLAFPNGTNTPNTGSATDSECHTEADGTGGSDAIAHSKTEILPWCGVPGAIKLISNVPTGDYGTITVTFGVNGAKWSAQNADVLPGAVPFKLVATQQGVAPGA